jgi:O-antigen ligase
MILFYLLTTVLPLTRHPIWSLFVGDLTVIKYLGLACVIYAGVTLTTGATPPAFLATWQARIFLLFLALATLSFFTLTGPVAWETSVLMIYVSLLMLFFATVTLVNTLSRLRWTLLSTLGGLAFASLHVLREYQGIYRSGIDLRPGWVVGDPNYFTLSTLFAVPLAFALLRDRGPRWQRAFCLACLVVILMAVTVASSRGGFIALAVSLLFVLWQLPKRARNLAIVAALVLPLSLLSPVSPLQRLIAPTFSDKDAEETRYRLWNGGLRMFQTHPVFGVGVMNFKPLVPEFQEAGARTVGALAHNTYIELGAEMGLLGLGSFVGVWIAAVRSLQRARMQALRLGIPFLYLAAVGLQAGLIGYAVGIFFVSAQYQRLYWFTVFLSICMLRLVSKVARRHALRRERQSSVSKSA